ncbi:hypothetical protein ES708_10579 [subsurface metagenome]
MPLDHYEVRFKNSAGKWISRQIEDINGIRGGPQLHLTFRPGDIRSLDDIENLQDVAPYLKSFSITAIPSKTINIGKFYRLRGLKLGGAFLEKIEGLKKLSYLKSLTLRSEKIEFMDDLKVLKNLETLNLSNNNISKIEGLKGLKDLRKVDLSKNQISKIEGLDGLENLENLNLSKNHISKIDGLNGLKKLKQLLMSHNQISKLENLSRLEDLYELGLSHNQISKLENLRKLESLQTIGLNFNTISKIEGLNGLKNMQSVHLSNTKIKSIAGIERIPNLYLIDLSNTDVSSLEPLLKCKKISAIRAEGCPIRSLHGIHNDSDQLRNLIISSENLCPTGAQLYKTAVSRHTSSRNFDIREIPALLEFYRRSTADLALQHANHSTAQPLTTPETERLIHEATQKDRKILENAVDNEILSQDDPILSQITARFSIDISSNPKLKILL